MNQLPFTVYDFFGCLASGAVVMVGLTTAFVGYEPIQSSPSLIAGVTLVIAAYVIGHIVANLAGYLVERKLVGDLLHRPTEILVGSHAPPRLVKALLPGYSTPLPSGVQSQIKQLAGDRKGEALFFHCHAVMKSDSTVQARLETFLNLYGFCRNMAVALLIAAACLGIGVVLGAAETGPDVGPGWWLAAAGLGAVGMLYRYLKFYRQFAVELLTSFAESEPN